ncbi:ABC transporter substrate-binding protein [Mesorhizobium sp. M1329]|uniref:ABC transporter substrate-binding protein n=1 Tax=Mesorhizobium sp. M1329 TaxID=2957083 RepID=UPI00333CE617
MSDQHPYVSKAASLLSEGRATRREFLRTVTLLGTAAATAYAMADNILPEARAQESQPTFKPGGEVKLGMRVDDVTKPFQVDSAQKSNIIRQTLDHLTRTGADNITRPHIVTNWDVSEDLKTWTLKLRDDVTFNSGRKFTAEDVVWNLKFALDDVNGSSSIGLFKSYMLNEEKSGDKKKLTLWDANAIEKVDDFTVRLNLKTPQLAVPEHLFHTALPMMDPESNGNFGVGANGTGAFEVVEFQPRDRIVYKARANHWGKKPTLETFAFFDLGDNANTAIAALSSKQIDGLYEADASQVDVLGKFPDLKYYEIATSTTGVIRGKCDTKPFDDPRVRKALRLATDSDAILQLSLRGRGKVGEHHHVAPVNPEYAPLAPMKRDVSEAKRLLAEAGYANGLDLELNVPADYAYLLNMAQGIVPQWAEANVRVQLKVLPGAQYWEVWDKVPFGVTRWSHRPLAIMLMALAYRTGTPWNESSYSNPKLDELLGKAESTVDIEQRRAVMKDIELLMQEDGPIVQPIWKANYTYLRSNIGGFQMHPSGYIFGEELGLV